MTVIIDEKDEKKGHKGKTVQINQNELQDTIEGKILQQ